MLEHASGSLPISTMVILRPLLGVSDPWYQISFLALGRRSTPARAAAAWSKRYDPLLRHGFENADGLGSLGYQTGRQSLHRTSMDRLPRVAKFQTGKGAGCDVTESVNAHTW